jgi:hypothetical protein
LAPSDYRPRSGASAKLASEYESAIGAGHPPFNVGRRPKHWQTAAALRAEIDQQQATINELKFQSHIVADAIRNLHDLKVLLSGWSRVEREHEPANCSDRGSRRRAPVAMQ